MLKTRSGNPLTLLMVLTLALLLGVACGDGDDDSSDATNTPPRSTATEDERTPGSDDETPAPSIAPATPTEIDGDPVEEIRNRLEEEFEDELWFAAIEDIEQDGDRVILTMDQTAADIADEDIDKACTVVAGTLFSAASDFDIEEVVVENEDGETLASATGPQCQME